MLADWWYEPDHDFDRVERFRRAGRDFLSVAGTSSWNSLFPRLHAALPNIRGHARAARRFGASGLILTDWGDGGHFNLFGGSLFPLAAGAEAAWGDPERPEGELEAAFSEQVAGDPGGFAGSFAARLGRLHDAGFRHFNHSPLKTVFFETKPRATRRVPEKAALDRTLRQLRRLAGEAAERGLPAGQISLEWGHALDASVLAAERGLALLRYRSAADADPAEKRQLAEELVRLADRQRWLEEGFRQIWLRTSRPEGRETADALYRNAADALRRAARALAVRGRSRASTGTGEARPIRNAERKRPAGMSSPINCRPALSGAANGGVSPGFEPRKKLGREPSRAPFGFGPVRLRPVRLRVRRTRPSPGRRLLAKLRFGRAVPGCVSGCRAFGGERGIVR